MTRKASTFHHLDSEGKAIMVDVSEKQTTHRVARALGFVSMSEETVRTINLGTMKKGDVMTVARLAGIMGAKETSRLIPLCHPIFLNHVDIQLRLNTSRMGVEIMARCSCDANTGVEMEALTAVNICALTLIDMCKSADKNLAITDVMLLEKKGGRSGHYVSSKAKAKYPEFVASVIDIA